MWLFKKITKKHMANTDDNKELALSYENKQMLIFHNISRTIHNRANGITCICIEYKLLLLDTSTKM